ncbi:MULTISPECIES: hypothetical protein [unclassified Rhizobium]|uniref:hypothetical protein n=1 Tax=unclassified Rhizobium TaxID=2613769 RepID=UPI0006FD66B4|nr:MULTISPECIES: hypothetical protein [unclassified Rhizobium]KQV40506.1 hypothetical protein ASC86_21530 [Rhizobium sp. Root1212]KRD35551.1 hypothetical protein ASE37_20820 [Rhizobium sp. Root268]
MSSVETSAISPPGAAQRGLRRLMLKLPEVRGDLKIIAAKRPFLTDLCEAYEDACVKLQRLRITPGNANCPMIEEYEMIGAEIEAEIIACCTEHRSHQW